MSVLNILDRVNNGDYDELDASANLHPIERLLPGLTRGAQDKLIHDVSRDLYKKSMKYNEIGGKYNGKPSIKAKDEFENAIKAEQLEGKLQRLPENMQDSYLMSMIDENGNLLRYDFESPTTISNDVSGAVAYYAPSSGWITLPYNVEPGTVIHETGHRVNQAINPKNKSRHNPSPTFIMHGMYGNPKVEDYMVDANLGATIDKEIVQPIKKLALQKSTENSIKYDRFISEDKFVDDAIKELFPYAKREDLFNIRDMYNLSRNTWTWSENAHGKKYVVGKSAEADMYYDENKRKSRYGSKDDAIRNAALSIEGAAEIGEAMAGGRHDYVKLNLKAPETQRRMKAFYKNDWRKKELQNAMDRGDEIGYLDKYGSDGGGIVNNDPFWKNLYGLGFNRSGRYRARVANPYGEYSYYDGIDDVPLDNSSRYEYRNLDDGWSVYKDDWYKGATISDEFKNGRVQYAKEYNIPAADLMSGNFVVEDKNGRHFFNNLSDAQRFVARHEIYNRATGERPYEFKTFLKDNGTNVPIEDIYGYKPEAK